MTNNQLSITDQVFLRVDEMQKEGSLHLPKNYSAGNALKSAMLNLYEVKDRNRRPALEVCTKASVANALLDMITQGLNVAKNQGYFIVYGNKLVFQRSYFGEMAIAKRLDGIKDIKGYVVYEGDKLELGFDIKTGKVGIKNYEPGLNRNPNSIIGAMCLIIGEGEEGIIHTEYMDMSQIRAAWGMGQTDGNSKAHQNFPDQMALKTVINRACKYYVNSSTGQDEIAQIVNQQASAAVEELGEDKRQLANTKDLFLDEPEETEQEEAEEVEVEAEIVEEKAEEKEIKEDQNQDSDTLEEDGWQEYEEGVAPF